MAMERRPMPGRACGIAGCVVGSAIVAGSALRARRGRVGPVEASIFRWFNDRSGRIAAPVRTVMQSGALGAVYVATGITARRADLRRTATVAAVGTSVWIAAKVVKPMVGRGRPSEYLDDVVIVGTPQSGLGYPSGHAAVALTVALVLPAALGRRPCSADRTLALALGGATGAARMYVGAHLPLDIVGGLALGAVAGTTGSTIVRRM